MTEHARAAAAQQLELFAEPPRVNAPSARALEAAAELRLLLRARRALGSDVRLVLTENRVHILTAKRRGATLVLRLHRMFLAAEEPVLVALERYLRRGDRRAGRALDRFVAAQRALSPLPPSPRAAPALCAQGKVHDLEALQRELSARYFGGALALPVGWGRGGVGRRRNTSARLGYYVYGEASIRLHPVLDQEWVPRWFVGWVLYHELLHHVVAPEGEGSRRRVHTEAFRAREALYEHAERARAWEREHLRQLLASRRAPSTAAKE